MNFNSIRAQQRERNTVFIEPFGLLYCCPGKARLSLSITHHHAMGHWISWQDHKARLTSHCVCACVCVHMHVCAAGTLCLTACVTLHMLRAVCFVWQGDKRIPRQGIVREEGREKSGYMKAWNGTLAGLPIVSSGISVLIIIILLPGIFFFQSSICLSSSKFLFAILLFCSLFLPLSFFFIPFPLGLAVTLG